MTSVENRHGIGSLQESSLHAALKAWYTQPGDCLETPVGGFIVDIRRGELLIEIQTRNFSALKGKLIRLLGTHPLRLAHPIPQEKWIVRVAADGQTQISRRKSPKRGRPEQLFTELVRIAPLLTHPNLSVEVLFTREEEIWRDDGRGSWRRNGWSISERRLLEVVDRRLLTVPDDYRAFLPSGLPQPFTMRDLSLALGLLPSLAGKMIYCLRAMEVVALAGKRGRARMYLLKE